MTEPRHEERDEDLAPLDAELATLFAEERARDGAPADAKARALRRLEAATAGGGGSSGSGGSVAGTKLGPLVAALATGALLGGVAVGFVRPPRVVYVDRAAPAVVTTATPAEVSLPTVVRPTTTPSADPSPPPPQPASASTLAAERAILDEARAALGRGDSAQALDRVDRHAREFPHGQLTEEREALAVQALANAHRVPEAVARGKRFEQSYPNSVLAPAVEAALAAISEPAP